MLKLLPHGVSRFHRHLITLLNICDILFNACGILLNIKMSVFLGFAKASATRCLQVPQSLYNIIQCLWHIIQCLWHIIQYYLMSVWVGLAKASVTRFLKVPQTLNNIK